MSHPPTKPLTPRRQASCLLMVLMVYQLGACPCGCLEHNAWIQLLGYGLDHDTAAGQITSDTITVADADDHDCTGEPRPQYVDNTRSVKVFGEFLKNSPTVYSVTDDASDQSCGSHRRFLQGPDSFALAHALSRPAIQVYRL